MTALPWLVLRTDVLQFHNNSGFHGCGPVSSFSYHDAMPEAYIAHDQAKQLLCSNSPMTGEIGLEAIVYP